MIQRIQTVFLLLAIVCLGLLLAMPLTGYEMDKTDFFKKGYTIGQSFKVNGEMYFYYINAMLTGTAILLALVAIFLFKNRQLQMLLCWFSVVFVASGLAYVYYKYMTFECLYDTYRQQLIACTSILTAWNLLGIAAILLLVAAAYYIRKDEELIRSEARLR